MLVWSPWFKIRAYICTQIRNICFVIYNKLPDVVINKFKTFVDKFASCLQFSLYKTPNFYVVISTLIVIIIFVLILIELCENSHF